MIEEKVRKYLEAMLDIPVRMEEEPGLPEEYILIEKTGSGEEIILHQQLLLSSLIQDPFMGRHHSMKE